MRHATANSVLLLYYCALLVQADLAVAVDLEMKGLLFSPHSNHFICISQNPSRAAAGRYLSCTQHAHWISQQHSLASLTLYLDSRLQSNHHQYFMVFPYSQYYPSPISHHNFSPATMKVVFAIRAASGSIKKLVKIG